MGRPLRIEYPGALYHVTSRGNERRDIFLDDSDRSILIYLMKKHTDMTNRQIGELIGGVRYTTVSKAYQRFCEQLLKDRSLRRTIKKITSRMSHVEI